MKNFVTFALFALAVASTPAKAETRVRIGHFPNVTHVQALVAQNFSRQGKGWFEQRLGSDVKIDWFVYNAGPSAMEAIFANSIDVTYVGPSPAINAFSKAGGEEVRMVSGAVNGGSALVIQGDSAVKTGADLRGKKIATPQLGNTQDVACRAYLRSQGIKVTQLGGEAQVLPTSNPDQLALFQRKEVDAVWTVEPWVTRLLREAKGKILVDDKDSVTTVLVSSVKFSKDHRELLKKLVEANKELTDWIKKNPEEAQKMVVDELSAETKSKISPEVIAEAWPRIHLTNEIDFNNLQTFVEDAKKAGFLRAVPDLKQILLTP